MRYTAEEILDKCKTDGAAVLGFGISNVPLTDFLLAHGVSVTVRDGKSREKVSETVDVGAYENKGVKFIFGEDYLSDITGGVLFRTPGLRPDGEGIKKAVENGAILTSEMELFYALSPAHKIAITGSDGKTTTTTLTHLILTEAFSGTETKIGLGGNIGAPLLPRAYELSEADYAVTELSSFQLMTMPTPPEAAVITNITPNHLNWHTGMDEYEEAKLRVVGCGCRVAVLNYENERTRAAAERTGADVIFFSSKGRLPENIPHAVFLSGADIVLREKGEERILFSRERIKLPGLHNVENYMAAIAVTSAFLPFETLKNASKTVAETFGGVPHRLEFVRSVNGFSAYNGSIDSTPSRTAAALSALSDRKISLVCGGYDKNIPMEPLADAVKAHGGVLSVTVTGATSELIRSAFERAGSDFPEYSVKEDFDEAVHHATRRAEALGCDTLLLSPACASFDRFRNFEERGEYFKKIINNM